MKTLATRWSRIDVEIVGITITEDSFKEGTAATDSRQLGV